MTIDAPSWNVYVNNKYHPTLFPSGTIGQVYVPGKATFLGGTGMAITQKSKRKELAWKYLEMFSQPTFSTILNVGLNTLSPYYTVMETATEWSSAEYDTIKEQYKKAVPVQYPQSSFPQFTDLEGRKPFRALLIEITYKNYPLESLQQRMCKVVDHVMLPACKVDHMMISDKGCDLDTMSRNLTYSWAVDRPCRGGMSLPQDISLLCPVVPMKSRLSIGMMATAGIVMVIIVLLMVLVHIYQERPAIKKSSYIFTQLMLVGGIVATVGVYFMADTTGLCGVDYWFLGYGFILLMGSITLKVALINIDDENYQNLFKSILETSRFGSQG
jgi:hypothetical protein